MTLQDHYTQARRDLGLPAVHALRWARHALKVETILRDIEWADLHCASEGDPFAVGVLDGAAITVYEDPEPYDWGDLEPSEDDQRRLRVIGVGARVAGDHYELDAVWAYGYLDDGVSWAQWQREAVSCALEHGLFERARLELTERSEWAARDVMTLA